MSNCLEAISGADVIICCGPGGVGKTTVSASLAIALAEEGKRVCVMTVDPARRLADVLLAKRSGAEGFVIKPLDPLRLRRAVDALLDGGTYEDTSFQPSPVLVAESLKGA